MGHGNPDNLGCLVWTSLLGLLIFAWRIPQEPPAAPQLQLDQIEAKLDRLLALSNPEPVLAGNPINTWTVVKKPASPGRPAGWAAVHQPTQVEYSRSNDRRLIQNLVKELNRHGLGPYWYLGRSDEQVEQLRRELLKNASDVDAARPVDP